MIMGDLERMNNSPLNSMEEVVREVHLPSKVYLHDTTLRDGEQFPGVEFTKEDKIRIGRALSECGVHRIEIMPAVSVQDQETAAELNSMGLSAEIVGFCRAVKDDVQKAADAGCKAIVMEIMAFPRGLQALGWSFEDATGKMIDVSHFAKRKGLRVTVFFVCVLQAPLDFSKKFIQKVLAEGAADGVCIPDTFGTCMPNTIYHYVRKLREWTDKPIEIHPHNMYSLGAADALAGVMAGAEVVHVCVNGLGEGAGNAPLEAVVLDLPLMLGIDTGVRLEKIYELCKLVEELSRVPLQANWPLVGDKVFTTESGISVDIFTKMAKAGVHVPPAQDVATVIGRKRNIVLGKMSGRTSIEVKLTQLGLAMPEEEQIKEILERVKNRSIEMHDALSDEEFKRIVSLVVRP
jgi:methanogen homocitrate synthase